MTSEDMGSMVEQLKRIADGLEMLASTRDVHECIDRLIEFARSLCVDLDSESARKEVWSDGR